MRTKTKTYAIAGALALCAAATPGAAQAGVPQGGPEDDSLTLRADDLARGKAREIVVRGGDGFDTLTVEGSAAGERFGLSVKNGRVRLTRDIGGLKVLIEDIERLDIDPRGGRDRIAVDDLTGADLGELHTELGTDGEVDRVTVDGSDAQEQILVLGALDRIVLLGTPVFTQIDDPETSDRLRVNGRRGDDLVGASSALMRQTLDGGAGVDTVVGGPGDDLLIGGDDFDDISGGPGDDVAYMGGDADRFTWQRGDGSDVVEGGSGDDSMFFTGDDVPEVLRMTADGRRLRFTRDVGSIAMDLDGVEEIDTMPLRGADTVDVGDLHRTDVELVSVNLAPSFGTADPDGAADRIDVTGTGRGDAVRITGQNRAVDVAGLSPFLGITHAEPLDTLAFHGAGGSDTVDSSGLAPGVIGLAVD
jgi:Ca2+-binding RTX toxin-like protein